MFLLKLKSLIHLYKMKILPLLCSMQQPKQKTIKTFVLLWESQKSKHSRCRTHHVTQNNLSRWWHKLILESLQHGLGKGHLWQPRKWLTIVTLYSGGLVKHRLLKIDSCSCSDPAQAQGHHWLGELNGHAVWLTNSVCASAMPCDGTHACSDIVISYETSYMKRCTEGNHIFLAEWPCSGANTKLLIAGRPCCVSSLCAFHRHTLHPRWGIIVTHHKRNITQAWGLAQ